MAEVRVVAAPPVSVIVPSHNRREQLLAVLDGLAQQTARESMEVVVVLDGCRDGSVTALQAVDWPFALKTVEQPRAGVAAARNRGALESSHDLLVLLDDDLIPAPSLVAEHATAAGDGPPSATMGRHPPPATGDAPLAALLGAWWEDHFRRKAQPGRPWSFLDFCSSNSGLSRALLLDTGGFDERLPRGEDYELGIRLLDRGVRFRYLPSALGEHRIDTDLASTVAKTRAEGRRDVMIARRHPHVFRRLRISRAVSRDKSFQQDAQALRFVVSTPDVAERALASRMRSAERLEHLGLRRRWFATVREALQLAFALGVHEEVGTWDGFHRLLADATAANGDMPARLNLGPGGGLEPLPSQGTSSLAVWRESTHVTNVDAVDGGVQWDVDVIAQRVAAAVAAAGGPQVAARMHDEQADRNVPPLARRVRQVRGAARIPATP